jgi:hypothetical protein
MTVLGCVVDVNNGNRFQPSGNVALIKFSICNVTEQSLASLPYLVIRSWGCAIFLYEVHSKIVLTEIKINCPRRCLFHIQILIITHGCAVKVNTWTVYIT